MATPELLATTFLSTVLPCAAHLSVERSSCQMALCGCVSLKCGILGAPLPHPCSWLPSVPHEGTPMCVQFCKQGHWSPTRCPGTCVFVLGGWQVWVYQITLSNKPPRGLFPQGGVHPHDLLCPGHSTPCGTSMLSFQPAHIQRGHPGTAESSLPWPHPAGPQYPMVDMRLAHGLVVTSQVAESHWVEAPAAPCDTPS